MSEESKKLCLVKPEDTTESQINYLIKFAKQAYLHDNDDHVQTALQHIDGLIRETLKTSSFHKKYLPNELFCISCNENTANGSSQNMKSLTKKMMDHIKGTLDLACKKSTKLRQCSPIFGELWEIYEYLHYRKPGNIPNECTCTMGKLRTLKYGEILCEIVSRILKFVSSEERNPTSES